MTGLAVPNTIFQDEITRVVSQWLQPVNDAMNFACGLVGLNDAGVFQYGGLYDVNDYVVYANQLYKCIAPIAPAVLAPDADPTHWTLLANLNRSNFAQLPNIASLRAATAAAIVSPAVYVHGYYSATLTSAPDEGGGIFVLDATDNTTLDDSGLVIIDASGRRWKRQYTQPFNSAWFGTKTDGTTDDTPAWNQCIQTVALLGGGNITGTPGTSHIGESMLIPSFIVLDLRGITLSGTAGTAIISTAAIIGGVLTNITTQYGTGPQGAGTNFVQNAEIRGATFINSLVGFRSHRFNYGCKVEGCFFQNTLTSNSILATHSWNISFVNNFVGSLARFQDFVDWTLVESNSFESPTGGTGLSIGTGGWGGSYSLKVMSNGFHGCGFGVGFFAECYDTEISNNHFEGNANAIKGDASAMSNFKIHNNWIKANTIPSSAVVGITFDYLTNSKIDQNTFTTDGSSTFSKIINAVGTNVTGLEVDIPYVITPTGTIPAGYDLADTVLVKSLAGSNNAFLVQPTQEFLSGTGNYTFEKYLAKYNFVQDVVPYCTIGAIATTSPTLTTFIPYDVTQGGTLQPVLINVTVVGVTNTYLIAGLVTGVVFTALTNAKTNPAGAGLTVTLAASGGKLQFTFAGADANSTIQGLVKAL